MPFDAHGARRCCRVLVPLLAALLMAPSTALPGTASADGGSVARPGSIRTAAAVGGSAARKPIWTCSSRRRVRAPKGARVTCAFAGPVARRAGAPIIAVTAAPAARTRSVRGTVAFRVTGKRVKLRCTWNGNVLRTCRPQVVVTAARGSAAVFVVRATNVAGRTTARVNWRVLAAGAPTTGGAAGAPTVVLAQRPPESTASTSAAFAWTASGSPTSTSCRLDDASTACSSPRSYTGLEVGAHEFAVTVRNPAGSASATAAWTVTAPAPPDGRSAASRIFWGAWVNGRQYGLDDPPWDMQALDVFEANAGKRVSILHFGQPWYAQGVAQPFYPGPLEAVRRRGAIPLLDWNSWDSANGYPSTQPRFTLRRITDGTHDAYIRAWALGAKAWGKPFFLRFNHEMNGTWYPWGDEINSNVTADFVPAWRHVHDIFEQIGATNVTWVWSPNVLYERGQTLGAYYPGDAYVDWTGWDGYNWGTNPVKAGVWATFAARVRPTYEALVALAPSKPMMIGEISSSEHGGSKAAWITDTLSTQLPTAFTRVKALVWFNWGVGGLDWPIESSAGAQNAFATAIASTYYAANEFGGLPGTRIGPP